MNSLCRSAPALLLTVALTSVLPAKAQQAAKRQQPQHEPSPANTPSVQQWKTTDQTMYDLLNAGWELKHVTESQGSMDVDTTYFFGKGVQLARCKEFWRPGARWSGVTLCQELVQPYRDAR